MSQRRNILITGAAGKIGRFITDYFSADYDLILSDKREMTDQNVHPFVKCDVTDLSGMRDLCSRVDMVIHLAANANFKAEWDDLLQPNVIGAYTIFQAAHEAGCRRVIFASSIHAVAGYPDDVQVHTGMPVRPPNLYGASKVWGETLARYYADQKGLSTICVRIGWAVKRDDDKLQPDHQNLHMAITYPDLARLIAVCLQAPDDLKFAVVHGLSDNRWKRLDISDARERLAYEPQDDAFAIAAAKSQSRPDLKKGTIFK